MRSLPFLFALVAISSGAIHWNKASDLDAVQTQANLIINAFRNKDVKLLYKLIPFGQEIDRYMTNHYVISLKIQEARQIGGRLIHGSGILIAMNDGKAIIVPVQLFLTPSPSSPTGYVLSNGLIGYH